jgi:hypothetical protein
MPRYQSLEGMTVERFLKVLGRAGLSVLATAAGLALYYGLGAIYPSRAFAPVQVVPLLLAVFFVTARMGGLYGLIPFLAPPLLGLGLDGIHLDSTAFFLTVMLLFELLFLLVVSRILRLFVKNGALLAGGAYVGAVLLTLAGLLYGLFPFLPLMELPTILKNFLFGSIPFAVIAFILFEAAGIALLRIKSGLLREVVK